MDLWRAHFKNSAVLLVQCPDQKGLDAAIADFIFRHDGNILHFEQHQAGEERFYLARVEWASPASSSRLDRFPEKFALVDQEVRHAVERRSIELSAPPGRPRVEVRHCLADLLYRHRNGELACEIALIISNHEDARRHAEFHNVPYHVVPVSKETKGVAEAEQHKLLCENKIDLIVLARYMQILSPEFIANFPQRIVNIHYSFLPAFVGAKPHQQAYERGVKILGATAHYVTKVLDDGPIIIFE